jgi:hypothetical protein
MSQGQPRQKVHKTPSQPIAGQWQAPVIPATEGRINRSLMVQASLGKKQDQISKINHRNKGWRHSSSNREST